MNLDKILKRFKKSQEVKRYWDNLYADAMDYVAPGRQIYDEVVNGESRGNEELIFDSTGVHAVNSFVSNIQQAIVPTGKKWIKLKSGPDIDEAGIDDTDFQLDQINTKMFNYLGMSNFATEVAVSFADLAIGTGALLLQKGTKDRPFVFHAIHAKEISVEKGPNGTMKTIFRCHKVKPADMEGLWPDAKPPKDLDPEKEYKVIELTEPHTYTKTNKEGEKVEVDGYKYTVILENPKHKLLERTQASTPWIVFRWQVTPGEAWGRGPVLQALPDIKSLNRVKELILRRGELDTFGVYTYLNDGVTNAENLSLTPHTFIPVEFNGGALGNAIQPLPIPGQLNLSQFNIQELRMSINKIMLVEPFGDVNLPVKSPTEVVSRQREFAGRIGSAFGRLNFEFVVPLVQRMLYILDEFSLIDMGDFTVDGKYININYESPIVQGERNEEFQSMQVWYGNLTQMFGELALAMTEPDVYAAKTAELLGVPLEVVPTKAKFAELKEQMQAQAQQQQQMQMQQQQQQQQGAQQGNGQANPQ